MDFGFDVNGTVAGVSQLSQALSGKSLALLLIGAIGLGARPFYVAFLAGRNVSSPVAGLSGWAKVALGLALASGLAAWLGRFDVVAIKAQRYVVDPYTVSLLKRDSCDPASADYCVIVFDDGREISVNWWDRRVDMLRLAHPVTGAPQWSLRPRLRQTAHAPDA
ncbi:hypothetical protein AB9K41_25715 [Cribrihabitans sp. XS_ASV171]